MRAGLSGPPPPGRPPAFLPPPFQSCPTRYFCACLSHPQERRPPCRLPSSAPTGPRTPPSPQVPQVPPGGSSWPCDPRDSAGSARKVGDARPWPGPWLRSRGAACARGVRPSHLRTELSGRWGSGRWEEGSPGSGRKEAGAEWSPRWGCLLPSSPGRDGGCEGEREGADDGRGPGRTLLCLGAPAPSARSLLPNFPTQPFTSSGTGCRHRLTRSCPREPRVAHVWTDLFPMPGGRVTGSTWGWGMRARAPGQGGGLLALPLFSWPFPPFPLAPIVPSRFLFLGYG